ncbi:DUF1150 family protein [Chachezhania sediminis]|uniref:DUF1150 family protein n=1 Tax=Chachezhania sediminis TaxID=2599291 RepID=UPI00131B575D|nr:DUF1150 family protein [Chachezhania sediminis]
MNTPIDLLPTGKSIVYVKAVEAKDLPKEVQSQMEDLTRVYAVHDADGQQLALVADRNLAFALARQHDLTPVTVH